MKTNLTPNEIDRIVEAYIKNSKLPSDVLLIPILRKSLATIELDRPKEIDLREVEKLVQFWCDTATAGAQLEPYKDAWRKAIGYTLNDLKP